MAVSILALAFRVAASDGAGGGVCETDGRVKHPEEGDDTIPSRTPESIEDENPGLADN